MDLVGRVDARGVQCAGKGRDRICCTGPRCRRSTGSRSSGSDSPVWRRRSPRPARIPPARRRPRAAFRTARIPLHAGAPPNRHRTEPRDRRHPRDRRAGRRARARVASPPPWRHRGPVCRWPWSSGSAASGATSRRSASRALPGTAASRRWKPAASDGSSSNAPRRWARRCPKASRSHTNSTPKASSWSPTDSSRRRASTRCSTASSSHR